ncbi:putative porin [Mucilaginibacter daejeonensis]|uniref:putative porin n=1 Tax=Mucilaginibacter daejeonensis TaxID=398049 RepID=UPI001D17A798|nr:putative porin [Mucilaginibacter daejeonensis]UEG52560.1 putative porin [Mucilaginibacter daejeonensis]
MLKGLKYFFLTLLLAALGHTAFAQIPDVPYGTDTLRGARPAQSIDSVRKRLEGDKDTVIYSAKYVKVTNERLLNDSTQVFPIDTGLTNFENYTALMQPRSPRIHLGNTGLPQRALLFEPAKTVGFDVGLHSLDVYMMGPQDVNYYRARVAYTNLSFFSGAFSNSNADQVFRMVHTQNIKPNWNFTVNFNNTGSRGYYRRQNVSDLNAAISTWYESKGKRYNLLGTLFFNNIRTPESGAILNESVFTTGSLDKQQEAVRLNNSYTNHRNNGFYLKQFYYVGRIDTIQSASKEVAKILPTQRVAHTFFYNIQKYRFRQNEPDTYKAFPDYYFNNDISQDSIAVTSFRNEFSYSFYLRGRSVSFVKNEVKLDVGLTHDLFHFNQYVNDSLVNNLRDQVRRVQGKTYQNIKLNAKFSYRFSDRVLLDGDFQQVVTGYNFGDYLYDAKLTLAGGQRAGKIILGAYAQNNEAPLIFKNWISNHYVYTNTDIGKQQINNFSFNYINDKYKFDVKAEYFLISGYQYFASQTPGGIDAAPAQLNSPMNLLKLAAGKRFDFGRWHFEDYLVYQQSDYQSTIRTPQLYNYFNFCYTKMFFKVLDAAMGVNVRYNTRYQAPNYAIGIGQFYNSADLSFYTYPVITPYIKATLFRTNLFIMYDYANQGLQSNGYYTVNRYPMPDKQLKFGVSWTFYN